MEIDPLIPEILIIIDPKDGNRARILADGEMADLRILCLRARFERMEVGSNSINHTSASAAHFVNTKTCVDSSKLGHAEQRCMHNKVVQGHFEAFLFDL